MSVSLNHPYLTKQLIAYIGNKRALLGFLFRVFSELADRRPVRVFLDPFAGSGAVSRLARLMGYRVLANDWEPYSKVLNTCHLAVENRDLEKLFAEPGGVDRVLDTLNSLPDPDDSQTYIARYFAPKCTREANYRRERLFYTRENALRIDAIREKIEQWYPRHSDARDSYPRHSDARDSYPRHSDARDSYPRHSDARDSYPRHSDARDSYPRHSDARDRGEVEKAVLLAMLIYQSATHTNTSGVFKACHKGFGGYGKDALKRIMGEIRIGRPFLIDGAERAEVHCLDAAEFAAHCSGDLCYLDPPYTIHQYGSNYHMLNTIALWDKPPVDQGFTDRGSLKEKAGIRRDWIKTRSAFCYRDTALPAIENLLDRIDCRFIALSYNTEGVISFEELYENLTRHGRIDLFTSDYVKYRGGKQSLHRENYNLEFLLVIERGGHTGREERRRVDRLLLQKRLQVLWKQSFYPHRIKARFGCIDSSLDFRAHRLSMPFLYRFDLPALGESSGDQLERLFSCDDNPLLEDLQNQLSECVCRDKRDEIEIILGIIDTITDERMKHRLTKRALWLLRKFAFRKYRSLFELSLARLQGFLKDHDLSAGSYMQELDSIEERALKRFDG